MKRYLEAFAEENFRLLFAKQNEQMESDGGRVSFFQNVLCIVTNCWKQLFQKCLGLDSFFRLLDGILLEK